MATAYSIMGLHFRYRLWIAEMNADITVLRIFDDYVIELTTKKNEQAIVKGIENFQQHFISLRKEIDELKHEMHLTKMTLAASAREDDKTQNKPYLKNIHTVLKKRYTAYRRTFKQVKKEFTLFESKWLQ